MSERQHAPFCPRASDGNATCACGFTAPKFIPYVDAVALWGELTVARYKRQGKLFGFGMLQIRDRRLLREALAGREEDA